MCTGEAPGLVKLSRPLRPGACSLCVLGQPALRSTDVSAPTWLTGCHAYTPVQNASNNSCSAPVPLDHRAGQRQVPAATRSRRCCAGCMASLWLVLHKPAAFLNVGARGGGPGRRRIGAGAALCARRPRLCTGSCVHRIETLTLYCCHPQGRAEAGPGGDAQLQVLRWVYGGLACVQNLDFLERQAEVLCWLSNSACLHCGCHHVTSLHLGNTGSHISSAAGLLNCWCSLSASKLPSSSSALAAPCIH